MIFYMIFRILIFFNLYLFFNFIRFLIFFFKFYFFQYASSAGRARITDGDGNLQRANRHNQHYAPEHWTAKRVSFEGNIRSR